VFPLSVGEKNEAQNVIFQIAHSPNPPRTEHLKAGETRQEEENSLGQKVRQLAIPLIILSKF
jgi:hypothetical protein